MHFEHENFWDTPMHGRIRQQAVRHFIGETHASSYSALVERVPSQLTEHAPILLAPIERTRSTSATKRRIENFQRLINELANHEMLADDIAWFLKFSPSGARKYIRELREAGVIELTRYVEGTASYLGKAVYKISSDSERPKAFLAAICETEPTGANSHKKRSRLREECLESDGRHFHFLADDTHLTVGVNRCPVARDPLVAALFGPALSIIPK